MAVFESDHRGSSSMRHHCHASPYVTIVLSGTYVEVRDAIPELCRSGTIVVHDAAEEHADRFASDTRCLNVELSREIGASSLRGNVALDAALLRDAVQRVVRSFYDSARELPDAVRSLQEALLQRSSEALPKRPHWLGHVIDVFPWAGTIPLREAAALAGVHETHFSRAFHRHVGMTANEYRVRSRVQLASKLLLTTTASLARIALTAGFSDQSHLTRTFRERLDLSPGGYRRTFAR